MFEYEGLEAIPHFEGGGMKKFANFQILSILPISSDRSDAMVNNMCVTIS